MERQHASSYLFWRVDEPNSKKIIVEHGTSLTLAVVVVCSAGKCTVCSAAHHGHYWLGTCVGEESVALAPTSSLSCGGASRTTRRRPRRTRHRRCGTATRPCALRERRPRTRSQNKSTGPEAGDLDVNLDGCLSSPRNYIERPIACCHCAVYRGWRDQSRRGPIWNASVDAKFGLRIPFSIHCRSFAR